ncbi:ATP-binding protein [Bradyrhizobium roseum]|uniref:ATP-binding protein n=1 Tax=Bradyrhizobium roseum TaxID=3056648 RepID=UPI00262AAF08|nr:ATP-binding protein [Bradyrhizobium roseus]WKA26081.1 ATP-binding protein [Bradyrhizobium roseus]
MSAHLRRMAARLWPDSLFRRLAIILFAGLLAAHLLSFGLVALNVFGPSGEQSDDYFMRSIAMAVAILDRVKPEERPAWLDRFARPTYRYVVREGGEIEAAPPKRRQENLARLRAMLGSDHDATTVFYLDPLNRQRLGWLIHLKDGSPLMLEFAAPRRAISPLLPTLVSPWLPAALAVQLCFLAFFTWVAVKLATRPLARLERAANSLGSDLRAAPLPEDGPKEVVRAATAFNAMQRRIAEQAVERIQILAGISRRLQTPITRMRLRADFLGDGDAREKLQGDLQEMQTLVKQGLALARGRDEISEQRCQTDLHALIDSLVCDYSDAGNSVRFSGERGVTILTHPQALRRIMINLIDNGLKFGEDVEVAIDAQQSDSIAISVSDRGPGIPDEHLKSVFLPFYRVEASRSRETGGTGLGLAIAQQLVNALRGTLTLANRDGGGLEARLELAR